MTNTRSGFLAVVLGLAALAAFRPLPAQEAPKLAPGARVRATWRDGPYRLVGEVRALRGDTLLMVNEETGRELEVPLTKLRSVEISRGGHTRATGVGVVVGGLAGIVVGAIIARDKRDDADCGVTDISNLGSLGSSCMTARDKKVLDVVLGGVLGTAIGALIGHNISTGRWESVPLRDLSVGLFRLPDARMGLGASLAF